MSQNKSILSKWLVEFATPVVVTVTTENAEKISLQNGLLLHELLSAFGHLDNINCSTRSVNHQIPVVDPHLRFERVSEVAPKPEKHIEQMLAKAFEPFDISKLPHTPGAVSQEPPSGWSPVLEQIVMRSMSFTEYEMNSHPLVFLTVISTADLDPIACMQELTSHQHIPSCYSTGQYDPNIHRVYLLLHDNSDPESAHIDKDMVLRQLKSKFSPTHTKMLCINSLPADSPNLQHPDIWEAWRIPMFFPQHAPQLDPSGAPITVGSRLSMEDFMGLRNFCIEMFQQEVLPAYERRVSVLSRIVTEAKKGMRNVIKNFWRKPQAQEIKKGSSRYRYDKIESQILLLADTAFNMRDYEAAYSMYKLVRDDFKSDKAVLHIAHVTLMMAACHYMLDPNTRLRDIPYYTETLSHLYAASKTEALPMQVYAYFALIMSEILTSNPHSQSPLDAAHILLQASNYSQKSMPLVSALLIEKASYCYLRAGQDRKFSLQIVLSGQRFQSLGSTVRDGINQWSQNCNKHSCVCFAVAMVFHDRGKWGTIKSRLWRSMADKLRSVSPSDASMSLTDGSSGDDALVGNNAKQALLFLLHILHAVSPTDDTYSGSVALLDAVNAYDELIHEDVWSGVNVTQGWEKTTTREILLNETSRAFQQLKNPDLKIEKGALTVIEDLCIPEIITSSVVIMTPLNGNSLLVPHGSKGGAQQAVNQLTSQLQVEFALEKEQNVIKINKSLLKNDNGSVDGAAAGVTTHFETNPLLIESWADKYLEAKFSKQPTGRMSQIFASNIFTIPINEEVIVAMTISNTLPVELVLKDFKIILQEQNQSGGQNSETSCSTGSFEVSGIDIVLPSGANKDLRLKVKPKQSGTFVIIGASYILGDKIQVIQHIVKPGPLLLRTQKQRTERQRAEDETLLLKVIEPSPCLCVTVNGGKPFDNILCGEIFQTDIEFRNEGNAPATDILFNFNYPIGAVKFENEDKFLPFFGQSCTAMRLPRTAVIQAGESVHLKAWFRLCDSGKREISMLVSYQKPDAKSSRTSFTRFDVSVSPAISTSMSIVGSKTESLQKTIVVDISNSIDNTFSTIDDNCSGESSADIIALPAYMSSAGESCTTVDAMLVVGDIDTPQKVLGTLSASGDLNMISSDERMTICAPVKLHRKNTDTELQDGVTDANNQICNSTWISTLQEENANVLDKNVQVFDLFSYLSYCNGELQDEIHRAEERRQKAELSGEEFTPRTISQVRRSRTSELANSSSTPLSSRPGTPNRVLMSPTSGRNSHLLDVIATAEVEHNEATVVVAWTCYWRGKVRHGLNILHHQKLFKSELMSGVPQNSLISTSPPSLLRGDSDMPNLTATRRQLSLISQHAADRLTVTLVSPQTVSWDFSTRGRCPVNVSLELYSNHPDVPIVVSVESLEWIDLNADVPVNANKSSTTGTRVLKRPPVKGLRWEGKSRFVDIVIPPLSSVCLPFLALIARKGVYDMKRFRVTVSPVSNVDPSTSAVTPFIKVLQGQSLVIVTDTSLS